jgi:hypothetical protein
MLKQYYGNFDWAQESVEHDDEFSGSIIGREID